MDFEDQDEHEEEEEEMGVNLQQDSYETMNNKLKMCEANTKAKYKECLKNHAVGMGGHAVDGCGEFMPAGPEGSLDALKCAACNCHRNFHRKDSATSALLPPPPPPPHHPSGELFFHPQFAPCYRTPTGYIHVATAQRPLALPSTSGGQSREDQEDGTNHGSARKRFRTKFTQEQKEKMLGLAERLGWRIQKHDEGAVNEFCNETGVKRHVLKVWMHNNKHTLGKKP